MQTTDIRHHLPPDAVIDQWAAPDGWPIRRIRLAPRGARRGALLYCNGRADFIEKYLEALCHWRDRGWAVTSFDWRGQGLSGRLSAEAMFGHADSFDPWIADLGALVADWRREEAGPYAIIGHSTGGNLVLRDLMARPGDADAAVLISPLLGLRVPLLPDAVVACVARRHVRGGQGSVLAWGQKAADYGAERAAALTGDPDRYADEGWWWQQTPGLKLGGVTWGWLAAAFESIGRIMRPGGAERVTTPVLLLAATHDRVVSTGAMRRLLARLPDGRGRFFADAAHELLRERDAVRLPALAAIDAFLDEKAPL